MKQTLLNEDWSDWETSIILDFPNLNILLSFVDEDKQIDFCHNLFDSIESYNNREI